MNSHPWRSAVLSGI